MRRYGKPLFCRCFLRWPSSSDITYCNRAQTVVDQVVTGKMGKMARTIAPSFNITIGPNRTRLSAEPFSCKVVGRQLSGGKRVETLASGRYERTELGTQQ
ncbi:hypothetical protein BDQ94DRAFT_133291 [Aspergillus welwitschiae]|uniref:Uncharacterized protein n=1 Tax=Aspergillus welwitschiae TaxID=1341132 RepID=A0A3F3QKB6_9EURO|nr:hypothetical protein BDQ94DRAFT_133291 [Aspergillus welwitschiae]RDH39577.1 hypothetical protein BDQ94DRAFT_133291 [Aspergillus welwitschiae]